MEVDEATVEADEAEADGEGEAAANPFSFENTHHISIPESSFVFHKRFHNHRI